MTQKNDGKWMISHGSRDYCRSKDPASNPADVKSWEYTDDNSHGLCVCCLDYSFLFLSILEISHQFFDYSDTFLHAYQDMPRCVSVWCVCQDMSVCGVCAKICQRVVCVSRYASMWCVCQDMSVCLFLSLLCNLTDLNRLHILSHSSVSGCWSDMDLIVNKISKDDWLSDNHPDKPQWEHDASEGVMFRGENMLLVTSVRT